MARRLIGLDVGTNALTIAEVTPGTPPRLDMFAQVALARSAMREGEVTDEGAVTDAVSRLCKEVGLKKVAVRVGIASPRVVVRQVEMPVMTRDELASALQFQAGELIPIPIDDAVLDFAILRTQQTRDGGEPTMQVLLAAAYANTVMRLVSAVEAGGLPVAAVDLAPLALTRALARNVPELVSVGADGAPSEQESAEGIVSLGGGTTSIAVHENGVPQFVRVIGTGGRELTDAIAMDLNVPADAAEALKRQIGSPTNDEMVGRARTSIDRPLSVLLDEVRSSFDYYRNQPGSARLLRISVTGGTAQLPGLPERLGALVGVPVEHASMRDSLRIGNIGFSADEMPRLEPYLPAAVGLALGGAGVGTVINLLPRARKTSRAGAVRGVRLDKRVVVGALAGIALVGGLTYLANESKSSAKAKQAAAEADVARLQAEKARLAPKPGAAGNSLAGLQAQAAAALGTDVEWSRMIDDLGHALPSGVWLQSLQAGRTIALPGAPGAAGAAPTPAPSGATSYAGAVAVARNGAANASAQQNALAANAASATPGGTTKPGARNVVVLSAACTPLTGPVSITGVATSMPAISTFVDNLSKDPDVTGVWISNAQASKMGTADVINFTASATLADGAHSNRIAQIIKGARCR